MRLNSDLGDLETLQIWHDNIDGMTAWKLTKVIIVKAGTFDRYVCYLHFTYLHNDNVCSARTHK